MAPPHLLQVLNMPVRPTWDSMKVVSPLLVTLSVTIVVPGYFLQAQPALLCIAQVRQVAAALGPPAGDAGGHKNNEAQTVSMHMTHQLQCLPQTYQRAAPERDVGHMCNVSI